MICLFCILASCQLKEFCYEGANTGMCNGENWTKVASYNELKASTKPYFDLFLYLLQQSDDIFEMDVDLDVNSLNVAGTQSKIKIINNDNYKFKCKSILFDNVTLIFDGDNITANDISFYYSNFIFGKESKLVASRVYSDIKTFTSVNIITQKYEITDSIPPKGDYHLKANYFVFDFDCPINMSFNDTYALIQSKESRIFIEYEYEKEATIKTTLTHQSIVVTNISDLMYNPILKLTILNSSMEFVQLKVNCDSNSTIKLINSQLKLSTYDFPNIISQNSKIELTNNQLSLSKFEVDYKTEIFCINNAILNAEIMTSTNATLISNSTLYLSIQQLTIDEGSLDGDGVVISSIGEISDLWRSTTIINIPVELNEPLQYTYGLSEIYLNKAIFKSLKTPGILLSVIRDTYFFDDKNIIQEYVNRSFPIIEAPDIDKIECAIIFEKSSDPFDLLLENDPWTSERIVYDIYAENNVLYFKLLENPYKVYAKFVYSDDPEMHGFAKSYLTSLKQNNWTDDITEFTQAVAIYVFDEPPEEFILSFPELKHKYNIHFFGLPNSEPKFTMKANGNSIQSAAYSLTLHSASLKFDSEISLSLDEITIYDNVSLANAVIKNCKLIALAPTVLVANNFNLSGLEKINITTKMHDMRIEIGDEYIRAAAGDDELQDLPPFPKYEICYIIDTFSIQKIIGTNGKKKVNIRSKTYEPGKAAKVLLKDFTSESTPIYFDFPITDEVRINTNNHYLNVHFGTGRYKIGRENSSLEIPPQNIAKDRLELHIPDYYTNVSIHGPELVVAHTCNLFIDEKISFDNVVINGSSDVMIEALNANTLLIDRISSLQLVKQLKVNNTTFQFSATKIAEIVITDSCNRAYLKYVKLVPTEPIPSGRYQIVSSFVDLPRINLTFPKSDGNLRYSVEYEKRSVTFVSEEVPSKGGHKFTDYLILGGVSLAVLLVFGLIIFCVFCRKRTVQDTELSAPLMDVSPQA